MSGLRQCFGVRVEPWPFPTMPENCKVYTQGKRCAKRAKWRIVYKYEYLPPGAQGGTVFVGLHRTNRCDMHL